MSWNNQKKKKCVSRGCEKNKGGVSGMFSLTCHEVDHEKTIFIKCKLRLKNIYIERDSLG